jgi:hypothetical protein
MNQQASFDKPLGIGALCRHVSGTATQILLPQMPLPA